MAEMCGVCRVVTALSSVPREKGEGKGEAARGLAVVRMRIFEMLFVWVDVVCCLF